MTPQQAHKRQLKNLLINTSYQLRFTLFMVGVAAVLMAGLGYLVMREVKSGTKISIQQLADPDNVGYLGKDPQVEIDHLQARERRFSYILVGVGVLLSIGLGLYGIKMTHRVAGPLYKVALYFDKVRDGKFDPMYGLRKGDELIEFYEHFKEAYSTLRGDQETDVAMLKKVIAAAESAEVASRSSEAAAALAELRTILQRKEASLG